MLDLIQLFMVIPWLGHAGLPKAPPTACKSAPAPTEDTQPCILCNFMLRSKATLFLSAHFTAKPCFPP